MKYLKYLVFVFVLFLTPNVFAKDVNVTSNCYGTTGYSSMYNGHEVEYQTDSLYNFGTTYTKQLSSFETQLRYSLSANTDYVITFNTNNSNDFRNNFKTYNVYDNNNNDNNLVKSFTFVSMKKVQISFKTTNATDRVTIQMGGSSNYDNITGVNNWNIKSAILTIPDSAPSGSTNQDIIDNQTNNTNNIINNNNQNTSDIINNNNQNTQDIINSMQNCTTNYIPADFSTHTDKGLTLTKNNDGSIHVEGMANSDGYVNFFYIDNSNIYFDNDLSANLDYVCSDKGYCLSIPINGGFTLGNGLIWSYVFQGRFYDYTYYPMLTKSPFPSKFISPQQELCTSKLDDTTNAINETNEYLKDDTDPSIQDNDFLSMFNSVGVSDPLNYLLTLPTQFINKIVSLSDSCSTVNLGTLYGVMITLPCINLENILGTSVWNIIDVIFSVSLLVVILKNLYDTFSNLLTMGAEKEAKEKFSMPTPMDFLSMILGGDR